MICYDEIVIFGTLELSLPFLSNSKVGRDFQNYTFNFLNIQDASTADSEFELTNNALSPNDKLKITIFLRPQNRWIMNLNDIIRMIESTGLSDANWLTSHIIHIELLSFREQVEIMSQTDILIAPHGAALTNLIFLRPHSAVIEVFTAPWYEIGYQATSFMFDLHYQAIAHTDVDVLSSCSFPSECTETPLMVQRRELICYGIRQCNAFVKVGAMEIAVWLASQSVRILKRQMFSAEMSERCEIDRRSEGREFECVYRKSYKTPLA